VQKESLAGTKSGVQGMAMLLIDNELQQNRTRLATLEERLYIDLENQHSELQKEINDNTRAQTQQLALIDEKERKLEKYRVENRLDVEMQKSQIALMTAQMSKIPADREQTLEDIKQRITNLNEQLSNILDTKTVTQPIRSQVPTGTSRRLIVFLAGVLAVIFGLCSVFIAEFVCKVREYRESNEQAAVS